MKNFLMVLSGTLLLASCATDASFDASFDASLGFSGVDPALTVQPTQVMVLGTAHLSGYKDDLTLDDLEPLLERLEAYGPDIITTEDSSGMTCNRARTYPREHEGYANVFCFDGAPYRAESGLSVSEGSYRARNALLDWPGTPTAAERRQLAAAFIASEEPASALVQWLRLGDDDRVAGDGLGPLSVAFLERYGQSLNETSSIAARLAARRGLEQVYYADDHGSFLEADGEAEAIGARINELGPPEGDPCWDHYAGPKEKLTGGDLLGAYRDYNNRAYGRKTMDCDWKLRMNDDAPEKYGRQYTLSWQARNLRMVALIVSAAINEPGGKVLSVVGASHKPYFEAYLDQMHDIEVVNTDNYLK